MTVKLKITGLKQICCLVSYWYIKKIQLLQNRRVFFQTYNFKSKHLKLKQKRPTKKDRLINNMQIFPPPFSWAFDKVNYSHYYDEHSVLIIYKLQSTV